MNAILSAAELAARHGLKRIGREWRGACPACGYRMGLTLSEKAGRALWHCKSCGDQAAVTAALLGPSRPEASVTPSAVPADQHCSGAALAMWARALPAQGSVVGAYLRSRGLALPAGAPLRVLYGARHPGDGQRHPVMLAAVADRSGRTVAVHRTFLARDGKGKAAVEPARLTLGPVRGGTVRLHEATDRVVLAEGIETALAAAVLLKLPSWAACSAGNLADAAELPPAIREVTIAADNDRPGRSAAKRAAERLKAEGRAVRVAMPNAEGEDFADVLLRQAR